MKRVIFNQKGGVGKTSIACNIAAALAAMGQRVLVIDLDAQANSSQYLLGAKLNQAKRTVADFFNATLGFSLFKDSLNDVVTKTAFDDLWVAAASKELAELQPKLEARYKVFKLAQAIDAVVDDKGFDEVIIDTPPALNFYSMSALLAADRVLIPFDCDAFSAKAVHQVMEVVDEVAADHRPNLEIEGIVINHFQAQAKLPQETAKAFAAKGFKVLQPYLSSSILMKESHEKNIPVVYLKRAHKLSQEYQQLAKNLLVSSKGKKAPPVSKGAKRANNEGDRSPF